jgi:hypothetical protein
VEKWWIRQVRIGQTQTMMRKSRRTKKNKISPTEIAPADLEEKGCMRAV